MMTPEEIQEFVENHPRLVRVSKSVKYPGLSVLKYHNRVFYDNLWDEHPLLTKLRGVVVDEDYNLVLYPFDKFFNYKENGTYLSPDAMVRVVRKVNGFMASARYVEGYGLVVATTGTLDSEFADLAKKRLEEFEYAIQKFPEYTFIFEIVDETDPHIIEEEFGVYLIGARNMTTLEMADLDIFDGWSLGHFDVYDTRPIKLKFSQVLEATKVNMGEGWMVYAEDKTFKLKSPYYLTIKLLGRMKADKLEKYLEKGHKIPWMDEDYHWVLEEIEKEADYFLSLNNHKRVEYVREIINERMFA